MGRRKGSRNRGHYYPDGREWMATIDGELRALEFGNGTACGIGRLRSPKWVPDTNRLMTMPDEASSEEAEEEHSDELTVTKICSEYLVQVQATGAKATLTSRTATLFDFCHGLSYRFAQIEAADTQAQRSHSPGIWAFEGVATAAYPSGQMAAEAPQIEGRKEIEDSSGQARSQLRCRGWAYREEPYQGLQKRPSSADG